MNIHRTIKENVTGDIDIEMHNGSELGETCKLCVIVLFLIVKL